MDYIDIILNNLKVTSLDRDILEKYASEPYTMADRNRAVMSGAYTCLAQHGISPREAEAFLLKKASETPPPPVGLDMEAGEDKTAAPVLPVLAAIAAPVVGAAATVAGGAMTVGASLAAATPLVATGGAAMAGRSTGALHHHFENVVQGRNDRTNYNLRRKIEILNAANEDAKLDLEFRRRKLGITPNKVMSDEIPAGADEPAGPQETEEPNVLELTD